MSDITKEYLKELRIRITVLETERDNAIQQDKINVALARTAVKKLNDHVAELEAENSRLKAENHFAGSLTLANQNRIAELEAQVRRLDQEAERHALQYRELEAQVAHFQTEYQDEIGRTELIENVARLKAELAEVDEIRDTVVFIHEREALARQEERETCKAEINRLSEALDGALAADWSSLRETLARQEEREALLRDVQAMREQYTPLEEGESVMLDTLQDHVERRARSTP